MNPSVIAGLFGVAAVVIAATIGYFGQRGVSKQALQVTEWRELLELNLSEQQKAITRLTEAKDRLEKQVATMSDDILQLQESNSDLLGRLATALGQAEHTRNERDAALTRAIHAENEVAALSRRVTAVEAENSALRAEVAALRQQVGTQTTPLPATG